MHSTTDLPKLDSTLLSCIKRNNNEKGRILPAGFIPVLNRSYHLALPEGLVAGFFFSALAAAALAFGAEA